MTETTFQGLPNECFGVLKSTNELILIKKGVRGYFPQREENQQWDASVCDHVNAQRGITKAQRSAMEHGSMFGWSSPLANPSNYDENGDYIKN